MAIIHVNQSRDHAGHILDIDICVNGGHAGRTGYFSELHQIIKKNKSEGE